MKNTLILIPFNALLGDVCDYAEQTIRLLAKENTVIGVALGNPLSLYRNFKAVWQGDFLISHWGTQIFRPIMIIPLQRFEIVKRLNIFLNIVAINLFFLSQKKSKILWFFEPKYLSTFLRFSAVNFSVFDCIDYFSAYGNWHTEQIYCLKKASLVTVNSHTLHKKYSSFRRDSLPVPLGLSVQDMPSLSFSGRKKEKPFLTFGFVGVIGYRLDFNFIDQLISKRSKDAFVFIGPQDFDLQTLRGRKQNELFQKLIRRKKIEWIPKLSRKKTWLKGKRFDVGIIPYDIKNPFNRYSFPMKVMEYFYCGLPVVATYIKELAQYSESVYVPQRDGWNKLDAFLRNWNKSKERNSYAIALKNTWKKKIAAINHLIEARMRLRSSQE